MRRIFLLLCVVVFVAACQPSGEYQGADGERGQEEDSTAEMLAASEQSRRELPQFVSRDELGEHTQRSDCWVLVRTRVYDFSSLFEQEADELSELASVCGADASELYDAGKLPEDIGQFYVADLMEE